MVDIRLYIKLLKEKRINLTKELLYHKRHIPGESYNPNSDDIHCGIYNSEDLVNNFIKSCLNCNFIKKSYRKWL